ncbi:MAG: hypothetical protein WCG80_01945 [Spirochaetales bacterium]
MTLHAKGPWLVSAAGHLVVVALFAWGLENLLPAPPERIQMHLTAASAVSGPASASGSSGRKLPYSPPVSAATVNVTGAWQPTDLPGQTPELLAFTSSSASLDELLAGLVTATAEPPELPKPGWGSGSRTEGHELPPLPPPSLVPPQGARWNLVFSVPAEGGFATSIEGLGEGNPELDLWLRTWLRDATFPASTSAQPYTLRWTLILEVGRPE